PAPILAWSPQSIVFPNQVINTTSTAQNLNLMNNGSGNLIITALTITGPNASEFTLTSGPLPITLPAGSGATASVQLFFTPTSMSARSATLVVTTNAPGGPQNISLSGTGIGTPKITFGTSPIPFGNQQVNTSSAPIPLVINNTGTA